jgi:hypothetical protein
MVIIKTQEIRNVGKNVEKREPLILLIGYQWYDHFEKQYRGF